MSGRKSLVGRQVDAEKSSTGSSDGGDAVGTKEWVQWSFASPKSPWFLALPSINIGLSWQLKQDKSLFLFLGIR